MGLRSIGVALHSIFDSSTSFTRKLDGMRGNMSMWNSEQNTLSVTTHPLTHIWWITGLTGTVIVLYSVITPKKLQQL